MKFATPWRDRGVVVLAVAMVLTLLVSVQPSYASLSLFHSVRDPIWSVVITSFALFVLEIGSITAKVLCIWIPAWDKNLTRFMVFFLFITFGANVVHGWQSLQDYAIDSGSIYGAIRADWWYAIPATLLYAGLFPFFQGVFSHAFVVRWKEVDTSVSELETARNELRQLETERDGLRNEKKQGETKRNEQDQLISDLKQRIAFMQTELEKRPFMIEETAYPIAKRNITLDQLTSRLNLFLEAKGVTISRATLDRMLKSIAEMEEV